MKTAHPCGASTRRSDRSYLYCFLARPKGRGTRKHGACRSARPMRLNEQSSKTRVFQPHPRQVHAGSAIKCSRGDGIKFWSPPGADGCGQRRPEKSLTTCQSRDKQALELARRNLAGSHRAFIDVMIAVTPMKSVSTQLRLIPDLREIRFRCAKPPRDCKMGCQFSGHVRFEKPADRSLRCRRQDVYFARIGVGHACRPLSAHFPRRCKQAFCCMFHPRARARESARAPSIQRAVSNRIARISAYSYWRVSKITAQVRESHDLVK